MSSKVQSVLFDKKEFSNKEAKLWLRQHDFTPIKLDITENLRRFRIREPIKGKRFRTIEFDDAIQAVIMF